MSTVQSYRELIVWRKSMALVKDVYLRTQGFPKSELYGLTSQLRRAAVSVPSNIAEGQGRLSKGEFKQFLGHARGSLLELETQILIAQQLGYLPIEQMQNLLDRAAEAGRILKVCWVHWKSAHSASRMFITDH
jgi:four helix bundle protein